MKGIFDSYKSFALVGLSSSPKSFSRTAFKFLKAQGCRVYPVNPRIDQVEGEPCYPSIASLPAVDAALMFTSPRVTEELLRELKDKGISFVLFQQGSADQAVLDRAAQIGLEHKNSCVFLQHSRAGFPHSLHRFINRTFKIDQL